MRCCTSVTRATCAADSHDLVDRRDIGRIVDRSRPVEREIFRDVVEQLRRVRASAPRARRSPPAIPRIRPRPVRRHRAAAGRLSATTIATASPTCITLLFGERRAMRERDLGAAAAGDRRMPRDDADACHVGCGENADHALGLRSLRRSQSTRCGHGHAASARTRHGRRPAFRHRRRTCRARGSGRRPRRAGRWWWSSEAMIGFRTGGNGFRSAARAAP